MVNFPDSNPRYHEILISRNIPREQWRMYNKWARFYLHFGAKYSFLFNLFIFWGNISHYLYFQNLNPESIKRL
jgi:hypothetical protein